MKKVANRIQKARLVEISPQHRESAAERGRRRRGAASARLSGARRFAEWREADVGRAGRT